MCVLCISNPFVDWHALDPPATEPAQAGTGEGGATNGTSVNFNPNLVNQLDSGSYWYNANGTVAQTISYGFTTSSAFAAGFGETSGWSAFTEAQKTAVRQMMTLWNDLIAPSFVESTGSPNTADIKFSNSTTGVSYAHAYFPGQVNDEASSYDRIEGSVWLNPVYNSGVNNLVTPTSGVYGYMAILHEIGHSLGLDHGGNYNGGSPAYGNTSTGWLYTQDSHQYTIMSYFNASNTGANWGGKYAQTPMVYDILAIQQMYGADYTTRAGNTIYGFNSNTGNSLYDFSQNTSPILTIWDGNGIDTIDLSGWSSASVLTLSAGSYSSVNGMTKNLAIAYDVDIENATGGSGNDTITGNDLGNVLIGNGGADTINGAGGNDTVNGGTGVDILTGGAGDDTIYFDNLDNLALLDGGVGFDTLIQLGVLITFDFAGHSFERLLNIITDLGSAAWSEQTDYYDLGGLYYECDITYDNGTRSVTEYDVYNIESWSEWTVTYDANGDIISEVFVPDDGSGSTPTITSNGAGAVAAVSVVENSTTITTVNATDPDAAAVLTYSIIGGADAAKFTINVTTGLLSFISAPNFEAPTDVGANNTYNVQVRVSNGALTDAQSIVVTVTDVEEPTFIDGTSSNNVLTGTAGLNIINGLAGNDTLAGLGGADTLIGGTGTDTATYIASAAGVNVSLMTGLGSGGDAEGDTLATIENLTGSNLNDTLEGNGGNNNLAGGLGIDTVSYANALAGVTVNLATTTAQNTIGAGSDTLTGFENVTGSNFNDTLTGTTANNVLRGRAGNDTLNGGTGLDTMFGGTGNDTYVVDNVGDIVDETGGDGTDTIQTSLAFSLAALGLIENLTLTGSAAIAGTGNALNNVLTGNTGINILTGLDGNDTLNGGAGADTMIGGTGNDTYVIDNAGDVADETGGDGTDTIQSSITFSLSDALHAKGAIENLALTGTTAIYGTGNALANVITGNTGNNILAGLGGADTLIGGTGTDTATYIASMDGVNVSLMTGLGSGGDAEGDTLSTIENLTGSNQNDTLEGNGGNNILAGGLGIDTVSYANALAGVTVNLASTSSQNTLGAGSDTLTGFENVTGSNFNDNLTGTTGNNVLRGLAGNDTLNGGVGLDTMSGGTGNDTYVVDNVGDIVDETGGDGIDTIQTSFAFSLAIMTFIENLNLTGSAAISGTGNDLNNVLTGNTGINTLTGLGGNDILNGGAGADTMVGGTGDDTYVVDNVGDVVSELVNEGTDTAHSSITFSLGALAFIENVALMGTTAINGTGNALANFITGNTGNNVLAGLGGADQLIGGTGTDTATYFASTEGIKVSLMTGFGSGGDAEGDTLATIENLTGSNHNDTLEGNGGANALAGGLGIDTVSYEHATAGVTIKLATTSAQNTIGAGTDTLTGFENVTGSNFNDNLTGTTGNNVLNGLAGNDILAGGSGSDTFDFSLLANGSDVITDFVTGVDDIDLIDLLDSAGLGSLDYATLIAEGNLIIQTGAFITGTATNSAATLDTRLFIDVDGLGAGGSVLIATLEDTLTSAGDFLV